MPPPSATALCYDYARVEAIVLAFVPAWRQAGFDAVVAIARGGLVPGVMAATELDLPLHALTYDRRARRPMWYSASLPATRSRLLLVEDIAGRGTTLSDCAAFLRGQGHEVHIFTLAHDAQSRIRPDYGAPVPDGCRAWFPWERTSISPGFDATDNQPNRPEYDYAYWAIDLDGILLMDLPEADYAQALNETLARRDALLPSNTLPGIDLENVTIITGRPEQDRERTKSWLDRHGFHGSLVMRDARRHGPADTPMHKAQALLARCHTHFLESDPVQALQIARIAPVARVIWWNGGEALAVHASEVGGLKLL